MLADELTEDEWLLLLLLLLLLELVVSVLAVVSKEADELGTAVGRVHDEVLLEEEVFEEEDGVIMPPNGGNIGFGRLLSLLAPFVPKAPK